MRGQKEGERSIAEGAMEGDAHEVAAAQSRDKAARGGGGMLLDVHELGDVKTHFNLKRISSISSKHREKQMHCCRG